MNEEPLSRSQYDLILAEEEGRLAFSEKKLRTKNPYAAGAFWLAAAWWHGWDCAQTDEFNARNNAVPPSKNEPLKKVKVTC